MRFGKALSRPGAVLVTLLALGGFVLNQRSGVRATVQEPRKEIRVKAKRFKFVPSRIKVPAGTTLEIVLSSQDVEHGFKIPGTDVDVVIPARGKGETRVLFEAREEGRYRFECSRVCGAGHSSMRGVIRVTGEVEQSTGGPLPGEE